MDYVVGIDLGSTSLKAVVYDLDGHAVARASRPTERDHPDPDHPDWVVWPPQAIWGGVRDALKEATAQLDDPKAIRGVAAGDMLRNLMYKGLVKIVGRAEVLGRPMLYGTTRKFLEVFGLNSLKDLPESKELKKPDD
ncbi:MAG: SMC-Scp complex subunit ScpB [Planctomycetota bacterium]